MSSRSRPAWLPDETQELLLRAALGERERALPAWEQWYSRTGVVGAGPAEVSVLPLAWRNLSGAAEEPPGLERHLRAEFGVAVPGEAIAELEREPVSFSGEWARRARARPPTALGLAGIYWDRYRRLKGLEPAGSRLRFLLHAVGRGLSRARRALPAIERRPAPDRVEPGSG